MSDAVRAPVGSSRVLLAGTIFVVAANLRPTITALGPVLSLVGHDTGLGPAALGLLGAVPPLAFAVVSPFVHVLGRRVGPDRAVLAAIGVLVVGTLVRSLTGTAGLWIGTAVLSGGIAVCNVLVPAVVKRDFADEIPLMTGAYSAVLTGFAALASGLALPVAHLGGWRLGLGIWGGLSIVAAVVWLPRLRRRPPAPVVPGTHPDRVRSVWTSATAWWVTLFMGTQALVFYLFINWLPSIVSTSGVTAVSAGWYLFGYQAAGIVGGLGVGLLMRGRHDHRRVAVVVSVTLLVAVTGLLLAPTVTLAWLLLAGLSSGASLVVALALVGERSRSAKDAGRLSGMAQGMGYAIAAAGPAGAGALLHLTGGWTVPLLAVLGVGVVQLGVGVLAGRERYV